MPKKVIDIFPPKSFNDFSEKKEESLLNYDLNEATLDKKKKGKAWKIIGIIFSFFFFVFISLNFFFNQAEIKIWPVKENLNLAEKIVLDVKTQEVNLISKVVPGKILNVEKLINQEFSSTGKFLKKSEGVIRLYNAHSVQPETWREGTRFVSSEGKLFLSKSRINVPGARIERGRMIPSYVDVPVIAAEGGEDYNISPSHFSIFVFRGTPRYTRFYGESLEPMSGGGERFQVTREDLEKAENSLIEKAKIELESSLREKVSQEYVFLKETITTEILEKKPSVEIGTTIERFNFEIKVKGTAIIFKKKDIESLTLSLISPQVPEEKKLFQKSLKIEYYPEIFDIQSGKMNLSLLISAEIYPDINLDSFEKKLAGKFLNEAKNILKNQPEVYQFEINLFPFWLMKIPNNFEKIEGVLILENNI